MNEESSDQAVLRDITIKMLSDENKRNAIKNTADSNSETYNQQEGLTQAIQDENNVAQIQVRLVLDEQRMSENFESIHSN